MSIHINSPEEQQAMREAGRDVASVLEMIEPHVKPGVSTDELDQICNDYIVNELGDTPANVGYHGFPKTITVSVNHVVCHGIPNAKKLKKGDIINIDVAIIKDDGHHGDTSFMCYVGEPSILARRLTETTRKAMIAGIKQVRPGAHLGDIGHAIQSIAESSGYSVVREYCGHGINRIYHTDPQVLHYGQPGTGVELKEGMIFTIEPMLNAGRAAVKTLPDKWTVVTKDHSLSAQWEHTVLVTPDGHEVLSLRKGETLD